MLSERWFACLIIALILAVIAACIGAWVYYHEPRDYDTYGDDDVYEDDDYFSGIQEAVRDDERPAFPDTEEDAPRQLPLWETGEMPLVPSVPDLEPLPPEDFTGQFEFDLDKLERPALYADDGAYMSDWEAELAAWSAEQEAATAAWRAEMGLDCE